MYRPCLLLFLLGLLATTYATPLDKTPDPSNSTSSSLTLLAENLISPIYSGANGLLPEPYWPWISASRFTTMIHYFNSTGDTSYNDDIATGLLAQAGPLKDFSGEKVPGNDDQLWYGLACITAAETRFPGAEVEHWLNLTKNVFEAVMGRWQVGSGCNAGLGWQIHPNNPNGGYHYKNSITNGLAFQLAGRLARHTEERKYFVWANRLWDFSKEVGLIDSATHQVYDGVRSPECGKPDVEERWSYNVGVYLYGCAVMLDIHRKETFEAEKGGEGPTKMTRDWLAELNGLISAAKSDFTRNDVLYERLCEDAGKCNTDQTTFKAYLARWLGLTARLIPETAGEILPVLEASAKAVEESVGASPGRNSVGLKLTGGAGFDGLTGAGQQMFGVEVLGALKTLGEGRRN